MFGMVERCHYCGVKLNILVAVEDHLPIRVAGCLTPTYEALESALEQKTLELKELQEVARLCGERHTEKWLAEIPRVTHSDAAWKSRTLALETELEASRALVEKMREDLRKYSYHIGICPAAKIIPFKDSCMCGFDEALLPQEKPTKSL